MRTFIIFILVALEIQFNFLHDSITDFDLVLVVFGLTIGTLMAVAQDVKELKKGD